ncbi:MAG: hypothetical protein WCX28_06690 [Bacteriovoracaceae bacterium]|nr:hypothetical protein [Bacteroidota bacterium]
MRSFTLLCSSVVFCILILDGCDEGLNPNNVSEPGFGGSITFVGSLPPADSLNDLRIVAVPYYPIDTLYQTLIIKVIEGVIPFSADIRSSVDSGKTVQYEMFLKPKIYYYVAIVQQYGQDVFSQWKVVSVYSVSPNDPSPKSLVIGDGKFTNNVNFTVDFYHLPPQPVRIH